VAKVKPSIDHRVFFPAARRQWMGLSFAAMLRPQTPRRAPKRTIRIIEMIAAELGDQAAIRVFGAASGILEGHGLDLSYPIENRGLLRRHEVAELMRLTDMFLDLSDYQAFGRTGLESMACGSIPVVPVLGGTSEYAIHGHNAYVIDTRSDDAIIEAVRHFTGLSDKDRQKMRLNALETAANFTVEKASLSLLRLFEDIAANGKN
jgi:glycosyltransferase involved in cell wall biosynthesis